MNDNQCPATTGSGKRTVRCDRQAGHGDDWLIEALMAVPLLERWMLYASAALMSIGLHGGWGRAMCYIAGGIMFWACWVPFKKPSTGNGDSNG